MEDARKVAGAESGRKLLRLLLAFTVDRPVLTIADLVDELGMPVGMVYRYVALLREQGLVDSAGGKSYRLTDRVHALSEAASAARDPLGDIALPVMTAIRDELDETVLISRRSGWFSYCVERVESRQPVRLQFNRGQAMSLHAGSMARILLSGMSAAERESYFERAAGEIDRSTGTRLSDAELDALRDGGVAESFEEIDEGIWGAAGAIVLHGEVVAAIGTAAPIYRSDDERRQRMKALIEEAASEISAALAALPR